MSGMVIPEDLQLEYKSQNLDDGPRFKSRVVTLIERIARAEAKVAALEAKNGRLTEVVRLCEHKIEQHLQGQYSDGAALRAALAFARAPQPSPQDKEQG